MAVFLFTDSHFIKCNLNSLYGTILVIVAIIGDIGWNDLKYDLNDSSQKDQVCELKWIKKLSVPWTNIVIKEDRFWVQWSQ